MSKAKLGSGKRFAAIEKKAAASGARNPAAVAAAAGRKAHGEKAMEKYAKEGEARASHHHADGDLGGSGNLHAVGKTHPTFDEEKHRRLEREANARPSSKGYDLVTDTIKEK